MEKIRIRDKRPVSATKNDYLGKFLVEEDWRLVRLGLVPLNEDLAHRQSGHDASYLKG